MIVKRVVKKIDGSIEATLMLTGEQAVFLMNVGLGALVQRGAATLQDFSPEEFEQHVKEQQAAESEQSNEDEKPVDPPIDFTPANDKEPETTVTPVEPSPEEMRRFLESVDVDKLHKA